MRSTFACHMYRRGTTGLYREQTTTLYYMSLVSQRYGPDSTNKLCNIYLSGRAETICEFQRIFQPHRYYNAHGMIIRIFQCAANCCFSSLTVESVVIMYVHTLFSSMGVVVIFIFLGCFFIQLFVLFIQTITYFVANQRININYKHIKTE